MRTHEKTVWLAIAAGALLLASACSGKTETQDGNPGGTGGSGGNDTGGTGGTGVGGTGVGGSGVGGTGVGGAGGTGGTAGGPPVHAEKVDLLFMIDNSASMADKQKVLASTIPSFIERLASPYCVNPSGGLVAKVGPSAPCPDGSAREFPPVTDLHIGVISSSLGSHGADTCSNVPTQSYNPNQEDMSRLITRGATGTVPTYENKGFLNWDPGATSTPPGESDPALLSQRFADITKGVGQVGCGFESSLEAWYRFLVDPAPYQKMVPAPCSSSDSSNNCREGEGVDSVVLQQRADFLRQDSVVAVVMLTDENDCSVGDGGQNYLALQALDGTGSFHLARGTNACKTDPYDPNCKSCWEVNSNDYPECAAGWSNPEKDDPLNLRCYRQKERFGIDFLQPVERYVDALTQTHFDDGTVSPLFCRQPTANGTDCAVPMRSASQVVLAGIVGVPWQDIAVDPTDLAKGYRPTSEIDWDLVLGEPMANVEPSDPLMVESVSPRTGVHPATGQALASPGSGVPHAVNGAEWDNPARNDLQYACIFPLPTPLDCSLPENAFGCDCNTSPENPLCWNGSGYGKMQYYGKAYPGRRHLSVLQGLGSQGVVASICAPNLVNTSAADYGYGPALDALTKRIAQNLK